MQAKFEGKNILPIPMEGEKRLVGVNFQTYRILHLQEREEQHFNISVSQG
jgi:hypothetical protein